MFVMKRANKTMVYQIYFMGHLVAMTNAIADHGDRTILPEVVTLVYNHLTHQPWPMVNVSFCLRCEAKSTNRKEEKRQTGINPEFNFHLQRQPRPNHISRKNLPIEHSQSICIWNFASEHSSWTQLAHCSNSLFCGGGVNSFAGEQHHQITISQL